MYTIATLRAAAQKLSPRSRTSLLIVAFTAGALLAARSWLAAHDAALQLAATLQAQAKLEADANMRQRQRDIALAAQLAQLNREKRRVNSPRQAALELPKILPPLPAPITFELPDPSTARSPLPPAPAVPPTNSPSPAAPDPAALPDLSAVPALVTVPQEDLKPLYDYVQDCRACQLALSTNQADLLDERAKVNAITAQRDAALRAAKGGNWWTRILRNAKWFALGAAAATLATQSH
jgi:hypothetical protein